MRYLAVVVLLSACLVLIGCSSGPAPPQPGTPAFSWVGAKTAYHAGDYAKANESLGNLLKRDSEYTSKAQPWALVLSSGIAHGAVELADTYKTGVGLNGPNSLALRRRAGDCLRAANGAALPGVEVFRTFIQKNHDPQILLAFEYPPMNPVEPADLTRVAKGNPLSDSEADVLQRVMIQRGVVYALGQVTGEPEKPFNVEEMFKAATVQIPRERFLFGMAELLFEQAQLYDKKHIDDPRRANLFCTEAVNALNGVPEDKQVKDLRQRIQKLQKAMPFVIT